MKKLFVATVPFLSFAALAAEGDMAIAGGTEVAGAISAWGAQILQGAVGVAGAFLAFWAIKVALRIMKGIASAGK